MGRLFLFVVATLLVRCQGLEMTLDLNVPKQSGSRGECGVLRCAESYTATNATLAQSANDALPSGSAMKQSASISSLKVFKMEKTTHNINTTQGKRRRLIASVTSQLSQLTRVSNGVNVDGHLEAGYATLSLKFAKQKDCQADYACEAIAVGVQGNQLLSTSHLLQQQQGQKQHAQVSGEKSWTAETTIRVIDSATLIQQLDTKLGVLSSSVEKLENNMNSFKHYFESDLNSKTFRLEDKILSIGRDFITQNDRLEDKIESFKNRMEDNVKGLETSLKDDLNHKLLSCVDRLGDNMFETHVETKLLSLSEEISTVKTDVAQLKTEIKTSAEENLINLNRELEKWEKKNENLTQTTENVVCAGTDKLSLVVSKGFISLENSLQEKLDDITSIMNASAIGPPTFIRESPFEDNPTSVKSSTSVPTDAPTPKNCFKGMKSASGPTSYTMLMVYPSHGNALGFPVLCDTHTDGGGWIVFQRRTTGNVDFYRGWEDYKNGFGSMDGDFWLGNEKIHTLTSTGRFELRVDMRYNGKLAFAHYAIFSIEDEKRKYSLVVGSYDGTAGDSLSKNHNGLPFSTYDRDNDRHSINCAAEHLGAWWYNYCHFSNLNGRWNAENYRGPRWDTLSGQHPVTYTEMKMRRY